MDPVGNEELPGAAQPDRPALLLGLVFALGVCWPLIGGGRAFLLDWVMGPRTALLPSSFYGLSGGLTSGLPFVLVVELLTHLIGSAATWLPIAAFFPIATVSMGRLVGGRQWARLGAATLFAINPFVFQRLYVGQISLLLGYALLPLVVRSMVRAVDGRGIAKLSPVLWVALLTGMSPHFAWICGVLLFAVVLAHRRRLAALGWAAMVGAGFLPTLAYVFLPASATSLPVTVGSHSLAGFQTTGDPHVGLFGNVAGLYGFWRAGPVPVLPKSEVSGWFFLLLAVLVVVVVGAVSAIKGDKGGGAVPSDSDAPLQGRVRLDRRLVASVVVIGAVVGYFLALGTQGPTGPLFIWAYYHIPFFKIMREPEKFSVLLALGYAACFGWGIERWAGSFAPGRRTVRVVLVFVVAIGLPLAYTPTIFDGLDGQIAPSQLPASWSRAQQITGSRTGDLLFFPWHLYMAFPFTGRRVIANPAPSSFTGDVISGDNIQLGKLYTDSTSPRSAYIVRLIAESGGGGAFGTKVAPLGVQYVVLAKTVDWKNYLWLTHQSDLRVVLNTPSLEVWQNTAYRGLGHRGGAPVKRLSPVAYRILPGQPGWVTVGTTYRPGWFLNGRAARSTPEGVVSVWASASGGVMRYR
ncbi:MAG: hypothetical protein ACYCV7_16155, partial [Acidimicrobiales bacterium]